MFGGNVGFTIRNEVQVHKFLKILIFFLRFEIFKILFETFEFFLRFFRIFWIFLKIFRIFGIVSGFMRFLRFSGFSSGFMRFLRIFFEIFGFYFGGTLRLFSKVSKISFTYLPLD